MFEEYSKKYKGKIELRKYSAYAEALSLIELGTRVLEVGCANGRMTEYLLKKGCRITGVEILPELASEAEKFCEKVIVGNIENEKTLSKLEGEKYDIILFMDVLEHLINPQKVLLRVKNFLEKNGCIIISLPNIVFLSQRLKIFFGDFSYQKEGGILDENHLRFFTLRTAKKLFYECKYEIENFYPVPNIFRGRKLGKIPVVSLFLPIINGYLPYLLAKYFPSLFGIRFIFKLGTKGEKC